MSILFSLWVNAVSGRGGPRRGVCWCGISAQVVVSVVGNPPKMGQLQYMQDMTSVICSATPNGYETQLEDKRDGKKYWVRRQADGRCWMVQNLALDITTTGLKTTDTNITSNWTSSSTIPPRKTTTGDIRGGSTTSRNATSWNGGANFVITRPLNAPTDYGDTEGCGSSMKIIDSGVQLYIFPYNLNETGCQEYFTDVENKSPVYTADIINSTSETVNDANTAYDAHYLVGNYYSWSAATAGSGGSKVVSTSGQSELIVSGTATGSICPKGWRLPTGGSSGEYAKLLQAYGYATTSTSGNISLTSSSSTTNLLPQAPLYLVKSGTVEMSRTITGAMETNGGIAGAGILVNLWGDWGLARANTNNSLVLSTNANSQHATRGRTVRCVNDPSI